MSAKLNFFVFFIRDFTIIVKYIIYYHLLQNQIMGKK